MKSTGTSLSWAQLRTLTDIVWDATVGCGNDEETITEEKWAGLEARWGRGFTPEERVEVKRIWEKCLAEMAHP